MDQTTTSFLSQLTIREGTLADLDIIMHHRWSMYLDMGYRDESALADMIMSSRLFFAERLANGTYRAWLVENAAREVVAGGGLFIYDYHPSVSDRRPKRPLIANMYTEPPYRRKGIARRLMETMIGWCREQGFGSVVLHASADGKPLYESLGFKQTNEMRLMLR
jgi:GNAT superfamily N-acetyltransferase